MCGLTQQIVIRRAKRKKVTVRVQCRVTTSERSVDPVIVDGLSSIELQQSIL